MSLFLPRSDARIALRCCQDRKDARLNSSNSPAADRGLGHALVWRVFGLQNEGGIADRGAVEAGDNPVVQEHCGAGWIGEFKERECEAAHLDAGERETAQSRRGSQKPTKPCKENEPT